MVKAVERAATIGAAAIQIFGDNPTAWRRRGGPPTELAAFRERLAMYDIGPIAIHAAYLINLAGPGDDFFERSISVLTHELRAAPAFGARFVNVHTGSHKGSSPGEGIARLAEGVWRVLAEVDDGSDAAVLVLENSVGSGFGIGSTVAEFADIAEAVGRRGVPIERVAFCLDSAHLWAAGHRLSEPDEVDRVVKAFDDRLGLGRLAMIHLNDSKTAVGSRVDRHQHIAAGGIGPAGIARLLTHPALDHVAYYLETPGMDEGYDAVNVRRALDLAAGRPLDPLPPEAMALRGSRSPVPAAPADGES